MLNGFTEFNYLSAQKVGAYRKIMRFFYDSHLMQRSTLPPEDVLLALGGSDLDGVLIDLEALVVWGNLSKRRDGRRVGTLTEYARRRNLYHATPRGLSIEGFLADGLDLREDSAISPTGVISGLETRLAAISDLLIAGAAPEEIELLWNEMHESFVRLSAEVRGLTANLERKLTLDQREGFLEFKEVLGGFLERLARELSGAGRRVRTALSDFHQLEALLGVVGRVRSGRLTISGSAMTAGAATARARAEYTAMRDWFGREANLGDGLEYTVLALRAAVVRVLNFIDTLHRTRELGLGRAGVFAALAAELQAEDDPLIARAHLASALNLNAPLHATGDALEVSAASWSAEYLEPIELHPVVRGKQAATRGTAALRTVSPEAKAAAVAAQTAFKERGRKLLELFRAGGGELLLDQLLLPDIDTLHDLMGFIERAQQGVTAGPEGHLLEVALLPSTAEIRGLDWTLYLEQNARLTLLDASL